jgi:malate dehydrogenase
LNGEWGQNDVYLGSPVRLGREGIEEIIEIELNEEEMKDMETSSKAVKSVMDIFDGLKLM